MTGEPGRLEATGTTVQSTYRQKMLLAAYVCLLLLLPLGYVFLLAKLLLTGNLFFTFSGPSLRYIDFDLFYMAGRMMLTEHRHWIYDPAFQLATFNAIYPYKLNAALFAQYPPYAFILLAPMACLSQSLAFVSWNVLAFLLLAVGLVAVARAWRDLSAVQITLLLLGVAASLPTWTNLRDGGSMSWMAAAIAAFIWGWRKNRAFICGASLALVSTLKPQHCPFLGLAILVSHRWRTAIAAVLAEAVLMALAGFTVGWENVLSYPRVLTDVETSKSVLGVLPEIMINSRGLVGTWLPAPITVVVVAMTFLAGIIFTGWIWSSARNRRTEIMCWAMSLTLIVGMIASPHVHLHDCLLLSFAAILTLSSLDPFKVLKFPSVPLKIWSLILLFYPLFGFLIFIAWEVFPALMMNNSLFALLNIALLAVGTMHFRKLLWQADEI